METSNGKFKDLLLAIAVLSISPLTVLSFNTSPALAEIVKAFPNVSAGNIQMIVSSYNLIVVPFTIISGLLSTKMSKKPTLYLAMALLTISGFIGLNASTPNLLLIARLVGGIGGGLLAPFASGLIRSFYEGEKFQTMMGLQSATTNGGQMLITLVAGLVAVSNWHNVFYINFYAVLVALLLLTGMPEPPTVESGPADKEKPKMDKKVWLFALLMALAMGGMMAYNLNTAIILDSEGLGNAAVAGTVMTISTIGTTIAGILFGKFAKAVKSKAVTISLLIAALGMFFSYFGTTLLTFTIGVVVFGIGMGFVLPSVFVTVGSMVHPAIATLAFAILQATLNGSSFLFSVFLPSLSQTFFGVEAGRPVFLLGSLLVTAGTLLAAITTGKQPKEMAH